MCFEFETLHRKCINAERMNIENVEPQANHRLKWDRSKGWENLTKSVIWYVRRLKRISAWRRGIEWERVTVRKEPLALPKPTERAFCHTDNLGFLCSILALWGLHFQWLLHTWSDVSSDASPRRRGHAESGARQIRLRWRRSPSSLYWDITAGQFNFLKDTKVWAAISTFHITARPLLPFSLSRWRKVKERGSIKNERHACRVDSKVGQLQWPRIFF